MLHLCSLIRKWTYWGYWVIYFTFTTLVKFVKWSNSKYRVPLFLLVKWATRSVKMWTTHYSNKRMSSVHNLFWRLLNCLNLWYTIGIKERTIWENFETRRITFIFEFIQLNFAATKASNFNVEINLETFSPF